MATTYGTPLDNTTPREDIAACTDCGAHFDGGNGGDCPHCLSVGTSRWVYND